MFKRLIIAITILILITMQLPNVIFAHSINDNLSLHGKAALLMDAKTGAILYSKNSNTLLYPASLTKIATAIIAIEEGNLNDMVTVSKKARNVEGTRVYLEVGEQVSLYKLVQGLLINSGNDAAIAIAAYFDGSTEAFSNRMNDFLKNKVGVKNTTFKNPHGLFHPEHMTTAYDLAIITKYAMRNETFREIFGTKELKWDGQGWKTTLYHHNQLLWRYEGANGGKTGYVDQSGNTLVTTAKRENIELIAVILKASSKEIAYEDTIKLFDFGFENFETNMIPKNTSYQNSKKQTVYAPKPLYYTSEKGEAVNIDITETNEILIKDEDGNVLLQGEKMVKREEDKQDVVSSKMPETNQSSNNVGYWLLAIVFTLLIFGLIKYKRKNEQKNNDVSM